MATACGGDKKAAKAEAASENTEQVANEEENGNDVPDEEMETQDAEKWGDPAKATELDLATIYAGDFKPATTVIFEDTLGSDEKIGEVPTKWTVSEGSAEVAMAQGHGYITMLGGDTNISPIVGDNSTSYLPESFSLEFLLMFGDDVWYSFYLVGAEEENIVDFTITPTGTEWNAMLTNDENNYGEVDFTNVGLNAWNHFAVSFNKGTMKVFINGKRVGNVPNIKQPATFTIRGQEASGKHFIKNIRLAK